MADGVYIRNTPQALSQKLTATHEIKENSVRKLRTFYLGRRKRIIRYSLLISNIVLLGVVTYFVTSTNANTSNTHQNSVADALTANSTQISGPLDQVSSADIAVHIARTTGLPEATSVVNHADSVSANETTVPADISVLAKPQIVSGTLASRKDIHTYTVVVGDTVASLATKFGITSESIRNSNGLGSSNNLAVGRQLVLPPNGTNGIVYTVKVGDTPDSLAQKFSANKDAIISFNDAEVTGLKPGEQILIPDGVVQVARPVASYSYYSGFAWGGSSPIYNSNGYDYGWCTWHAANRRSQNGNPIPSNLGNASSWRYLAARAGMLVDGNPTSGSVAYYKNIGGLGHVGFVEQVNDDGSIWISDMNYYGVSQIGGSTPAGGWGRVSYHLVTPDQIGNYLFIH